MANGVESVTLPKTLKGLKILEGFEAFLQHYLPLSSSSCRTIQPYLDVMHLRRVKVNLVLDAMSFITAKKKSEIEYEASSTTHLQHIHIETNDCSR